MGKVKEKPKTFKESIHPIPEGKKPLPTPDTNPVDGDKLIEETKPKKDRLNIRLMKNFDQELDDITLGKEGYNLQEIGILKRAREVMNKGDADHPDEAMQWVRGEMADEAGVDIDEFMVDFDWGDAGKTDYASGGVVGLQNDLINQYDLY